MGIQPCQVNINIPHGVIVRAPGLLPMLYKVRELAEELGIPDRTLRDWLTYGAPHQRDNRNHIWINGEEFEMWVNAQRKRKSKRKLKDDEAYCLRCKKVVKLTNPQTVPSKGRLFHIKGICPNCECIINRGGSIAKPN